MSINGSQMKQDLDKGESMPPIKYKTEIRINKGLSESFG